jgi:ABC transport system ATP-binding/permease protein
MSTPRNLLNLKEVEKGYGSRSVLHEIRLGVSAGERIGVVGQNEGGKSTLLRLITGLDEPHAGTLTRAGDVGVALLAQRDVLGEGLTIRGALAGEREALETEWLETSESLEI